MRVYVLDASAFFRRKAVYERMVTVPEVVWEILDEDSSLYFSVRNLRVESASERNIDTVRKIAKKTGDIYRLSETDLKVLAKAIDEKEKGNEVVIVTDDYSIQNVAIALEIEFESVVRERIAEGFKWIRVCRGCGRKVENEICDVCGSETMLRRVKK